MTLFLIAIIPNAIVLKATCRNHPKEMQEFCPSLHF